MNLEQKLLGAVDEPEKKARNLIHDLMQIDDRFDESGVPHMSFRAAFSRMDTPAERDAFLMMRFGKDGFTTDRYGRYALTTKGMTKLGLEHKGKPVLIDRPFSGGMELADIADMAGDLPTAIGGIGMATAATGVGLLPGLALAGLGAAGGKGIGESIEALQGQNLQTPKEIGAEMLKEGAMEVAGEGMSRALGVVGRKLLAPEAHRMTPKSHELLKEAKDMGVFPKPQRVTGAPIQGRVQGMINKVLGDPIASKNSKALNKEMFRLKVGVGKKLLKTTVGEAVEADVRSARGALATWAKSAYEGIDSITGGEAVFPTTSIKRVAKEIMGDLPPGPDGKPLFTSPEMRTFMSDAFKLPDHLTATQLQAVRQRFWDAINDRTLAPGVTSRHARLLRDAATQSYADAAEEGTIAPWVKDLIGGVNQKYSKEIAKFDDALISRIIRDPGSAGAIEPEEIVAAVFKKGKSSKLNRLNEVLSEETKTAMRREAVDTLLEKLTSRGQDVFVKMFDGRSFLKTLDSYGDETLDAMFGAATRKRLYTLGEVTQLVSDSPDSGGLVAAHIAVQPWANLSRLAKLGLARKLLNTETSLKYWTDGLDVPKTRAVSMFLTRFTALMSQIHDGDQDGSK